MNVKKIRELLTHIRLTIDEPEPKPEKRHWMTSIETPEMETLRKQRDIQKDNLQRVVERLTEVERHVDTLSGQCGTRLYKLETEQAARIHKVEQNYWALNKRGGERIRALEKRVTALEDGTLAALCPHCRHCAADHVPSSGACTFDKCFCPGLYQRTLFRGRTYTTEHVPLAWCVCGHAVTSHEKGAFQYDNVAPGEVKTMHSTICMSCLNINRGNVCMAFREAVV